MRPDQAPVYTYKDLDITFATAFTRALEYSEDAPAPGIWGWEGASAPNIVELSNPQPVNPDGQGIFSALGNMIATGQLNRAPLPLGATVAMVRPHPGVMVPLWRPL